MTSKGAFQYKAFYDFMIPFSKQHEKEISLLDFLYEIDFLQKGTVSTKQLQVEHKETLVVQR